VLAVAEAAEGAVVAVAVVVAAADADIAKTHR
jgi:hypothetical protein